MKGSAVVDAEVLRCFQRKWPSTDNFTSHRHVSLAPFFARWAAAPSGQRLTLEIEPYGRLPTADEYPLAPLPATHHPSIIVCGRAIGARVSAIAAFQAQAIQKKQNEKSDTKQKCIHKTNTHAREDYAWPVPDPIGFGYLI